MMLSIRKISFYVIALMHLAACSTVVNTANLPIKTEQVMSLKSVVSQVSALNDIYGKDQVLIVVDIDNTLLTSSVDLGGDIWYQWQRGQLDIKPSDSQKVPCLFEDTIGLLYELLPMKLTEKNAPDVVSAWQKGGNTVMALTSRAPKYRAATERELARNGFDFERSALSPKGLTAPVYRENTERELSYMKGVMMTSGMNKGEMLTYILEKTKRHFNAIVFVDDSEKNIVNVYEKFKSRNDIDTNIYHYVNVEKNRELALGAVLTQEQADKMTNDWAVLNTSLNAIFPDRVRTNGCLSVN